MRFVQARSRTVHATDWLRATHHPRLLHVFDSACNLINEHSEVLSVVTPKTGNAPFNIVIQDQLVFAECLNVELPITISANQITLGDLQIDCSQAEVWNPCPDWKTLHDKRDQISAQVQQLPNIDFSFSNSLSSSLVIADLFSAIAAAKQLAGLGIGLTPAGDDYIIGAFLAAWIIHPLEVASPLAHEIANIAPPLTTSLSAAWIRSAGRGEAGILWHEFFDALISGDALQIRCTLNNIVAVGATSGVDALAGFTHTFIAHAELEHHVVPKRF